MGLGIGTSLMMMTGSVPMSILGMIGIPGLVNSITSFFLGDFLGIHDFETEIKNANVFRDTLLPMALYMGASYAVWGPQGILYGAIAYSGYNIIESALTNWLSGFKFLGLEIPRYVMSMVNYMAMGAIAAIGFGLNPLYGGLAGMGLFTLLTNLGSTDSQGLRTFNSILLGTLALGTAQNIIQGGTIRGGIAIAIRRVVDLITRRHFAEGGVVNSSIHNKPILVGEKGPELMIAPKGTKIIPNKDIGKYLSNGIEAHAYGGTVGAAGNPLFYEFPLVPIMPMENYCESFPFPVGRNLKNNNMLSLSKMKNSLIGYYKKLSKINIRNLNVKSLISSLKGGGGSIGSASGLMSKMGTALKGLGKSYLPALAVSTVSSLGESFLAKNLKTSDPTTITGLVKTMAEQGTFSTTLAVGTTLGFMINPIVGGLAALGVGMYGLYKAYTKEERERQERYDNLMKSLVDQVREGKITASQALGEAISTISNLKEETSKKLKRKELFRDRYYIDPYYEKKYEKLKYVEKYLKLKQSEIYGTSPQTSMYMLSTLNNLFRQGAPFFEMLGIKIPDMEQITKEINEKWAKKIKEAIEFSKILEEADIPKEILDKYLVENKISNTTSTGSLIAKTAGEAIGTLKEITGYTKNINEGTQSIIIAQTSNISAQDNSGKNTIISPSNNEIMTDNKLISLIGQGF